MVPYCSSRKYYKDNAIMRRDESFSEILALLEELHSVKFSLFHKEEGLDDPNYWKTPRVLAMLSRY